MKYAFKSKDAIIQIYLVSLHKYCINFLRKFKVQCGIRQNFFFQIHWNTYFIFFTAKNPLEISLQKMHKQIKKIPIEETN